MLKPCCFMRLRTFWMRMIWSRLNQVSEKQVPTIAMGMDMKITPVNMSIIANVSPPVDRGSNPKAGDTSMEITHVRQNLNAFITELMLGSCCMFPEEATNTPFCALQEKFHTFVLRGLRNISEPP